MISIMSYIVNKTYSTVRKFWVTPHFFTFKLRGIVFSLVFFLSGPEQEFSGFSEVLNIFFWLLFPEFSVEFLFLTIFWEFLFLIDHWILAYELFKHKNYSTQESVFCLLRQRNSFNLYFRHFPVSSLLEKHIIQHQWPR